MSDEVRLIALRDRAALDPLRALGLRPPTGGGGGPVMSRSVAGLLHADGFDSDTRSDYTFFGSSTVTTAVTGGRLRLTPPDDNSIIAQINGITAGKTFAQITQRYSQIVAAYSAIILRAAGFGTWTVSAGITDGYRCYADTFSDQFYVQSVLGSGWSGVDIKALSGWALATDYVSQFYVADGVQEGWIDNGDTESAIASTDHDGENTRGIGFWVSTFSSGYIEIDDIIYCKDRSFVCTNVPSGHQLKIYGIGDVELFAATEAGGTATIADVSKYANVANPTIPIAGWAYATIETAGDVEVARYDAAGIYPGDQYGYTP